MSFEATEKKAQEQYDAMKGYERELELLAIKEDYIKTELRHLRRELIRARDEIMSIQSPPLSVGHFSEMVDANYAVIEAGSTGTGTLVRVLRTIDRRLLKPNTSVAFHRGPSHALVDILPPEGTTAVQILEEVPDVSYADVGGLDAQKQEIREAVELPLTHAHLFEQIGIPAPRGVLFYGPPGTGKTMLAKAVAHHTRAKFISVVGSEFIQMRLGESPRMMRDTFQLAKEHAPTIIFIDEVDAIATKRHDAEHGTDREVQRVLMELLTQMDGFDQSTNVKVIMATNRDDTLDPALLRPGRLDRKVEFPLPDRRQKRLIFQVCIEKMSLSPEVDIEDYVSRPDKISGADIAAICMEAGMHAVRRNRYVVLPRDFEKAYEKTVKKPEAALAAYA
jgi:26S proteasome regulatory subunit T3